MLTRVGVVITFLFVSVFSQAQSGFIPSSRVGASAQFNLTVLVRTANGDPAGDARIDLREITSGRTIFSGFTNKAGVAELMNVIGATYDVVVTYKISEVQQRMNLAFGEHNLQFRLPQSDNSADYGTATSVSVAEYKVPDKARKEYKKAEEALSRNDKDETAKHLAKALDIYPNYAEALTLRGILDMDQNDSTSALAHLDAAIKADSSCATAYFAMGATFNMLSRFDEAERTLERGLSLDPQSWQGYFELGKALVGKRDFDKAVVQLQKAQEIVKDHYPPIHLVKAHAFLALKQYPGAMKELQDFLTQAPNDSRSANARQTLDRVSAYVAQK